MAEPPLAEVPDNELVARCLERDPDAWEEMVRRHKRRVFNIAYQFVGRFDEAEDLSQDLFLKIHGSLARYDRTKTFIFWLSKITKNLCIDHYRKRKKERALVTESDDALGLLESLGDDPYQEVRRNEKAAFLRAGLRQLAPPLRKAVEMRDIQELTYQEIATRLRIPEGTVKSRINRGRTELTRILSALERKRNVFRDEAPGRSGAARARRRPASS